MARLSGNEMVNGKLVNGYDYDLQAWVLDGIVQDCGHPRVVRAGVECCNGRRYAGLSLADVLTTRAKRYAVLRAWAAR